MASIEDYIRQFPPVTRTWLAGALLTTAACSLDLLSPFSLYFSWPMIAYKGQVWRLLTTYLFFSPHFNLDFLFNLYFLCNYCTALEKHHTYRQQHSCHFIYMLLFGVTSLTLIAPFTKLHFLGSSLCFMLVYIWSRKHPYVNLNFLGLFTFTAPHLPLVLLLFSLLLGHNVLVDVLGIVVGHVYYFLTDVFPTMTHPPVRLLATPMCFQMLFAEQTTATAATAAGVAVVDVVAPAAVADQDDDVHPEVTGVHENEAAVQQE